MSKKLIKDGMLLLLAKLVSIGSGTIIAIFVARFYGVSIYGQYTTALAFITFILTFTDLGFDAFMLKECSRDKSKLNSYYGNIIILKLVILFFSIIIILGLSKILGYSNEVNKLILILIPNCAITYIINTFFVVMQLKDRLAVNARIQIVQSALIILVATIVMVLGLNIYIYALLQSIVSSLLVLLYIYIIPVKFKITLKYSKILILGSIFFGLSSLLYVIYYKLDTIMLSVIRGSYEVGIYESAYKVINILITLIAILDNIIMPQFFYLYKKNKEKMLNNYKLILNYGIIFGIPFSLVLVYMSKYIINILYGSQYKDAIFILQILALTVAIRLLAATVGFVITASDNMKIKVKFQAIFALVNIVLNLILIPKYGVSGAAIATVITEVMVFITYYIFVSSIFNSVIKLSIVCKCIVMNFIMAILFKYLGNNINFILATISSISIYLLSITLFFKNELLIIIRIICRAEEYKRKDSI